MSYISRYEDDMDYAYDQLQKATVNAWDTPQYRTLQAMNVLLQLVGNAYKMIAEIGDKIDGED